jgi:MFS transporter, DHA2 family, multidrug resistance protein
VLGGIAVGALFVARQRALTDPLIDLPLFRAPAFSAAMAANVVATFVVIGTELFTAQYLQLVLDMGPLEAGLWSLPSVAGIIAGSMLAPLLVRRARPAQVVAGSLVLAGVGLGLLTQVGATSGLALIVAGTAVTGLGVGPVGTLGTDLIVGSAPPERAGAASGISETGTELGGALGIAVLGSIGAAVYRTEVADAAPAGADAAPARDTLGGAVELAARLPGGVGNELLDAAHAAFAQALQLAALLACAVALSMAIVTLALLGRRATPHGETNAAGGVEIERGTGPDE